MSFVAARSLSAVLAAFLVLWSGTAYAGTAHRPGHGRTTGGGRAVDPAPDANGTIASNVGKVAELIAAGQGNYSLRFERGAITARVRPKGSPSVYQAQTPSVDELLAAIRSFVPAQTYSVQNLTYTLEWNKLSASNGRVIYDIAELYRENLKDSVGSGQPDGADRNATTDFGSSYTLLSIVGAYVSYLSTETGYGDGAAHPYANRQINTAYAGTGQSLRISDIALEDDILAALREDPFLNRALTSGLDSDDPQPNRAIHARFLGAKTLAEANSALIEGFRDFCSVSWDADTLQHFAIFDYDPDKDWVNIRLGLGYGCELRRGRLTQIVLKLAPRSDELSTALRSAKADGEGFLLANNPAGLAALKRSDPPAGPDSE